MPATIREQTAEQRELLVCTAGSQHKYLVDYYGNFFADGHRFILMECMDCNLSELYNELHGMRFKTENELIPVVPTNFVKKLLHDSINGLEFLANEHQIIHRDVKPTNILLSRSGMQIKMCDFGIARVMTQHGTANTKVGTNQYMAPELQCGQMTEYTQSVDIWSLGVTVFETIVGEWPFKRKMSPRSRHKGPSIFEIGFLVCQEKSPQMSIEECPDEDVQQLVQQCLKKTDRVNYAQLMAMPFYSAATTFDKDDGLLALVFDQITVILHED
jgi:serine/threonine protein kinase